ncbi:MAG: DUF4124 domain-containing protein, partial [Rhodospirillales bacterium]|nr:DUF4124 domain-containing protein [Rhodospirillales bacterium]
MRIVYLIVLSLAGWGVAAQDVWKYVDERGVTHYTDQFVPGAVKVQLSSGNAAPVPANASSAASSPTRAAQQRTYRSFQVVRPANQDSVVNTGGVLQIAMALEPALMRGHSVSLYLDGKLVQDYPANALEHELQNVPRGEHTLVARFATSLRMSDLGYRNRNQAGLSVSVNSLEEYVRDLTRAISTPHEPYEKLGVHVDGEWRQLNA